MLSLLRQYRGARGIQLASTSAGTASTAAAAVKLLSGRFSTSGVPAPRQTGHELARQDRLHRYSGTSYARNIHYDGGARPGYGWSTAVIAIGSNQGDSVDLFRRALKSLKEAGIEVERHSSLYETAPAYVMDQPKFLNAAAVVRVRDKKMRDDPLLLLDALKRIEKSLGRVEGGVRFGPRPIDLDIIFHERGAHRCERLEVPHPRCHERGFVLAPLADLFTGGGGDSVNSGNSGSGGDSPNVAAGLQAALRAWRDMGGESLVNNSAGGGGEGSTIRRVIPLRDELWCWGDRTSIMGILNVTPDSFSDGGVLSMQEESGGCSGGVDVAKVVALARRMVAEGADFLDVGGQSTRPGATRISAEEEAARVVPVIRALADAFPRISGGSGAPYISVDTFYGSVATAAAKAGADVINDVSAGTLDPENMFRSVAEMRRPLPYVAMHMRGDPTNMQSEENTTYIIQNDNHQHQQLGDFGSTVATVVASELSQRAKLANASGLEPWRLWSDPGIGFAKTHEGCWDLLGNLGDVRRGLGRSGAGCLARAPMVLGASRKGFLGAVTGRLNPADRDAATAAVCVAGVLEGADVVRVHDVAAVVDALKVADAVRKARQPDREDEFNFNRGRVVGR